MNKEELKFQIISRLVNGVEPRSIATELETPYTTVLRIRKGYDKAREANDLASFIDMDSVVMDQLLSAAEANVPEVLADAASEAVSDIKKSKSMLEALSEDMIVTAKTLTNHIKSHAGSVEHVSELESLTSSLCALQNAFFNSNKTQVNVQNNYGDAGTPSNSYGALLSDKPANN